MKIQTSQSGEVQNPVSPGHFFKGLSWLILLNLLVKPLWIFGIDRQVQNVVGHELYGVYFSILNLSIILGFISDAGLTNMYNRQIALGEKPSAKQLLILKISLSVIYLLVFFFICWLTGIRNWRIVFLVGIVQVLGSFLLFFRSIITGNQQFKADAWISVADKVVTIILCAPLLYIPFWKTISLPVFLYIQCFSTGLALLAAIIIANRQLIRDITDSRLKDIFNLTYPFIILILLMSLHTRLDGFLLERIHLNGAYEAGVYAAAYRLLDAGNTVGYLAASFLIPYISRHLNDLKLVNDTVLKLRNGLYFLAIPAVVITWFFSYELVRIFYHRESLYEANVLSYCMLVLPAYYLVHLYGSMLTAKGLFRTFTQIVILAVLLNAGLNLVLVQEYGALGCCIAALISQYCCGILCFFAARKAFELKPGWRWIAGYLAAGLVAGLVCYCWKFL